ncbi:hypothetical protein E4U21_001386 [Claviceps maximensis]|nr:hypothetical protein E4U21_001386 [Claviceps maximensis]
MSSKSWTDRADKDLFFIILSIKNIGIISGGEWSKIGNHMRSLGYGFTNEGCRQHFQGLRRAQREAEENGTIPYMDTVYHSDPTQNPITRRPGPGRGRPKKHSLEPESAVGQAYVNSPSMFSTPGTAHSATPTPDQQGQQRAVGEAVVGHGTPSQPHAALTHIAVSSPVLTTDATTGSFRSESVGHENRNGDGNSMSMGLGMEMGMGMGNGNGNGDGSGNGNGNGTENEIGGGIGGGNAGGGEDADGEGVDEPPIKRPRLGDASDLEQSAPLDDDAVLALAAHNGPSGQVFHGSLTLFTRLRISQLNSLPYANLMIYTVPGQSLTSKMATNKGKAGFWGNAAVLHDLVICFYSAATEAGVMTSEIRKDIEVRMKGLNHQYFMYIVQKVPFHALI